MSENCTCVPKATGEAPDTPALDCPLHGMEEPFELERSEDFVCPACGDAAYLVAGMDEFFLICHPHLTPKGDTTNGS